jgi:hypothetical protein
MTRGIYGQTIAENVAEGIAATPAGEVQAGAERWATHWKTANTESQFIPWLRNWLSRREWADPCPESKTVRDGDRRYIPLRGNPSTAAKVAAWGRNQ